VNPDDALRQARALMHLHGLEGWTVKLDNAKARYGQCCHDTKQISLSRYLTAVRTEAEVYNTVLHEIAHALTPRHRHDAVWQRKFIALGGDGKTHSDLKPEARASLPYRYVGTCPNGHTSGRHKMSKGIKAGASCGQCSRNYDARYVLKWVDTRKVRV